MPGIGIVGISFGSGGGGGSVYVTAYSDAGFTTPITSADVGDTIYIKALPLSIAPVEYFFAFEDVNGELFNVYQGANDNTSWVVEGYLGVGSIYAFATEDVAEPKNWVGNSIEFETTGDLDAEAFLSAAGITDPTISAAVTQLVVDLKTDGLWTKIHALYPFVGGSATTHKFNLKDPQDLDAAFRMTFFGGITHDATGITGNGSNGYTNTNYNPLNEGLTNTSNAMFYMVGTNAAGGYDMGVSNTNHYSISRYSTNAYLFSNIGLSVNLGTQSDSIGFYINTRESATDMRVYKDGALVGSNTTSTTGAFPNANFKMMSLDPQYSSKTYQLAGISDGLTVADCANLTTINNTFQTALGR